VEKMVDFKATSPAPIIITNTTVHMRTTSIFFDLTSTSGTIVNNHTSLILKLAVKLFLVLLAILEWMRWKLA
jgi:hypothetical protein